MRNIRSFVRNEKNEYMISSADLVRMLTGNRHGYGFYHLTRWSSLCRMMEPVVVPGDGGAHRMLHLGAAFNMNDENDKKCGKRVYFTSFSFGPPENISMWTNYGIPNEEAVRITIPSGVMLDWVEDFNAGRIEVYGVGSDGALKPLASEACLRMVDVAYWSKKEVGRNKRDPNEGLFFYDGDKCRLTDCSDVDKFMAQQPYLFKEFGWNYEKETRLVLEFEEDLADLYKRVAVTFDNPLEVVNAMFPKLVTQGPWFTPSKMPGEKAAGHNLSEAKPSRYNGVVKMRSVCDSCPERDSNACKCPYKGQR